MVNTQLESKSIPSLEFNAISLEVETLIEIQRDLAGESCIQPIHIIEMNIYTDSICSLCWLNAFSSKMDEMQKSIVFVKNRIEHICRLFARFPITFGFIAGKENPADKVTCCLS